jgi:hypothetical protein
MESRLLLPSSRFTSFVGNSSHRIVAYLTLSRVEREAEAQIVA